MKIGLITGLPQVSTPDEAMEPGTAATSTLAVLPWYRNSTRITFVAILSIVFLTIGGLIGRQIWINSDRLNPTETINPAVTTIDRWSTGSDLPIPCEGMAIAGYERLAYFICGKTDTGVTGKTYAFDPSADTWVECAPKPTPVSGIQAVLIGERIYVPGGTLSDGKPSDRLEVYDPRQDEWEILTSIPQPRSGYALAELEGHLYLFGGWDGTRIVDTVFEYLPVEDTWVERSPLPTPRSQSSAVTVGSKIFVLGGTDGNQPLTNNDVYFPQRDQNGESAWEQKAPLPDGRYAMGAATMVDAIYVFGGKVDQDELAPARLLQYAPDKDTWIEADATEQGTVSGLAMLAWQTQLHLLGGIKADSTISRQHLIYQAVYTIQVPLIIR